MENSNNSVWNKVVSFLGLGCLIPLILFCLGVTIVAIIIASNMFAPATETVVIQPTPVVAIQPTAQAAGMATICDYAPTFTSEGQAVPAGTLVRGPALVKPNRDISWGVPVYIGEEYTTRNSDEVIWLLTGDNACVDSQSMFFVHWQKTEPNK